MKCNRDVDAKWLYMVSACCFGLVTILKISHGDEWTSIITFAALTLLWGSITYKKFKEDQDEDTNCSIKESK